MSSSSRPRERPKKLRNRLKNKLLKLTMSPRESQILVEKAPFRKIKMRMMMKMRMLMKMILILMRRKSQIIDEIRNI